MPIEIRELHIKVTVDATAGGKLPIAANDAAAAIADKDAVVEECVEQVLRIIDARKER